jgi:hypothetical protein
MVSAVGSYTEEEYWCGFVTVCDNDSLVVTINITTKTLKEERRRHVLHTPSLRHSLVGFFTPPNLHLIMLVVVIFYLSPHRKQRPKEVYPPSVNLVTILGTWIN